MTSLSSSLFKFDPERDWQPDEVRGSGQEHLRRYLNKVLEILIHELRADNGSISLSGLSCGKFMPFVSIGRDLSDIFPTQTFGSSRNLIYDHLWSEPAIEEIGLLQKRPTYRGQEKRKLLIKLNGHGETFGYISLNKRDRDEPFPVEAVSELRAIHKDLEWRIAEQVFSMRLRQLAEPLPMNATNPEELHQRIMQQLLAGFAVDGGILRSYVPEQKLLKVVDKVGELDDPLAEDLSLGKGVAGLVIDNPEHSWLIASKLGKETEKIGGIRPLESDIQRLIQNEIQAIIVMALRPSGEIDATPIGTLSCFFRRPMEFSWRGVAMFQAFCQQVADVLTLRKKTVELTQNQKWLELQNRQMTHAEIVALIAHDLFNKALTAHSLADGYIDKCRSALNDRKQTRSHEHLEKDAAALLEATQRVGVSLEQIRHIQRSMEKYEAKEVVNIESVLEDIADTLANPMRKANTTLDMRINGKLDVHGPKAVIEQVFYNLFINALDAIKLRASNRPKEIHVRGHLEGVGENARVELRIWDDGPGIDRVVFKNPSDIFEIAATSKPNGTGTGLPVSRTLLGRYFHGQITLEDPSPARFRISIPRNPKFA